MFTLINSNFNRTYNPGCKTNVLGDIKRLLTSRDTTIQSQACGHLNELLSRYNYNSVERTRMIEYLLDNHITVFLCEATSNLDFSLFRSVLQCVRSLWLGERFFAEEHAAHSLSAVTRALSHYAATDAYTAINTCLHFIYDLLNGIKSHKTTSPLSRQSAYSIEQLLACFSNLADRIRGKAKIITSSALVLHALISYQPAELDLSANIADALVEILEKWFDLLLAELNHLVLKGEYENLGMLLVVTCELEMNMLRLMHVLENSKEPTDFVHKILKDEAEVVVLKRSSLKLRRNIEYVMNQLVVFVKDNQQTIGIEEYGLFLKILLNFFCENVKTDVLPDFCDKLFSQGYLLVLSKKKVISEDTSIKNLTTQIVGEMLKILAAKYLQVEEGDISEICEKRIHMGLLELQCGIEEPHNIGLQLQKNQPYALLIYIYFYCQSPENPEEFAAPLLPHLVEHILRLPKSFKPPGHIIKALWLVFAMSTISNGSLKSLKQRINLEKATDRFLNMLHPKPDIYYTHNPAILFWAFSSSRVTNIVKLLVLSQWLKFENTLPEDFTKESIIWKLLLDILVENRDGTIVTNCMEALSICIQKGDESSKEEFSQLIWSLLPEVLSKALINYDNELEKNICYFLDIVISQQRTQLDRSLSYKTAVLISMLYSKSISDSVDVDTKCHFEFVCLKLCFLLLEDTGEQQDNKVLLTFINRKGFLPAVLLATDSSNDDVACTALQLLTYVIFCYNKNKYQPKSVMEIKTDQMVKSLRRDSDNDRGAYLISLIDIILRSGVNTPIVLTYELKVTPPQKHQCNALRALLFRIQLMLCCRDSKEQSKDGWKTLNSIFRHAIHYKNDTNLVATLTSQPWTYTLIRFQLTQTTTPDFLLFAQIWLNLLSITIKRNMENRKYYISQHSLIRVTLVMLKNSLDDEESTDINQRVISTINEILDN